MAIDSTWGGPTANSYVDLTTANSFLTSFVFNAAAWTSATTVQKEAALAEATIAIDNFRYLGSRYYGDQRLAFPRAFPGAGISDPYYTSGTTPTGTFQVNMKDAVERACAYQALYVCQQGGMSADLERQARGIKSYSEAVGPVSESADYGDGVTIGGVVNPAARLSPNAFALLGPYRTSKKVYRA